MAPAKSSDSHDIFDIEQGDKRIAPQRRLYSSQEDYPSPAHSPLLGTRLTVTSSTVVTVPVPRAALPSKQDTPKHTTPSRPQMPAPGPSSESAKTAIKHRQGNERSDTLTSRPAHIRSGEKVAKESSQSTKLTTFEPPTSYSMKHTSEATGNKSRKRSAAVAFDIPIPKNLGSTSTSLARRSLLVEDSPTGSEAPPAKRLKRTEASVPAPANPMPNPAGQQSAIIPEDNQWKVDKLLRKKRFRTKSRKGLYYLVRWTGYPNMDSWEKKTDIHPDLVKAFEGAH